MLQVIDTGGEAFAPVSLRVSVKLVFVLGTVPVSEVVAPVAGDGEKGPGDELHTYCCVVPPLAVKGTLSEAPGAYTVLGHVPLICRNAVTTWMVHVNV